MQAILNKIKRCKIIIWCLKAHTLRKSESEGSEILYPVVCFWWLCLVSQSLRYGMALLATFTRSVSDSVGKLCEISDASHAAVWNSVSEFVDFDSILSDLSSLDQLFDMDPSSPTPSVPSGKPATRPPVPVPGGKLAFVICNFFFFWCTTDRNGDSCKTLSQTSMIYRTTIAWFITRWHFFHELSGWFVINRAEQRNVHFHAEVSRNWSDEGVK